MDFQIVLDDISGTIDTMKAVHAQTESTVRTVGDAVLALCEAGWSGEAQESFLKNLEKWDVQAVAFLTLLQITIDKLSLYSGTANDKLSEGRRLEIR